MDYKDFLPYIDADDGLKRVGGMKKLYAKLLKSFPQYADMGKIAGFLSAGDKTEAQNYNHALKGVAGNLSLKYLFDCSAALDLCFKSGQSPEKAFDDLKKAVAESLPVIEKFIVVLES